MSKNVKKRNWAFILYPESAPEDWKDKLQQTGLQCAISPIHDKDIDEGGNGETLKKAHYHVIVCYAGPTSYNVVKQLTDSLNQPIPKALEQVKGYYRYFTHKDNPEKAQYDERDIQTINGWNIMDFSDLTRSEVNQYKQSIHKLILESGMVEYADLMDYLLQNEMYAEYDVASSHTLFFDKLLTSRRHRLSNSVPSDIEIDPDTGEVLEQ